MSPLNCTIYEYKDKMPLKKEIFDRINRERELMKTEKLLRIYKVVTKPKQIKYPPIRKNYNINTFG